VNRPIRRNTRARALRNTVAASSPTTSVPNPLVLNPITPDYAGIFAALQADLADNSPDTWNDLAAAATGIRLLSYIASVGAFAQGSIGRSTQEVFLDTARSPSGILRCAAMQGTHIIRSRPGIVSVSITRTDTAVTPLVVPAMTQFQIGGQSFYNSSPVTLPGTGTPVTASLYRGVVQTVSFTASGQPFQKYVIGSPNAWNLSDLPLTMIDSANNTWTGIRTGMWQQSSGAQAFFEKTLPDGTVQCEFGDGVYGAIPPAGTVTFSYVFLASAAATQTGPTAGTIGTATGVTAQATVTIAATPNQDPPPPEFYKTIGPGSVANNQRAVTRDDHRAIALAYPGVIDALFRGQAELNPSDLRYMNVVAATLLTTSVWTQQQWLNFKQYFENSVGIATTTFTRSDPIPVPVSVVLNIGANQTASISSLTSLVNSVVTNYFTPSNTSLGWSFEPSDLILAIMESATYLEAPGESGELIDYVQVVQPTGPIVVAPYQYLTLAGPPTLNITYSTRGLSAAATSQIVGL
jgi:hypothetical protein